MNFKKIKFLLPTIFTVFPSYTMQDSQSKPEKLFIGDNNEIVECKTAEQWSFSDPEKDSKCATEVEEWLLDSKPRDPVRGIIWPRELEFYNK